MKNENQNIKLSRDTKPVPILKIRMMTDDEWNRIAYRQYLERQASGDAKAQNVH